MKAGRVVLGGVLAGFFATAGGAIITAQPRGPGAPTFNEDVAPILFNNCVTCHRPGQVAPMSLVSYEDARPWARAIKQKVDAGEMPPWFADPRFGTFRNGRGLTPEQIETIAAWAAGGAPQGTAPPPELPRFAEGWSHPAGRPPDMVIEMPIEFDIPAQGELPNFSIYQKIPFQEDRFLEAVQLLPSNLGAVHHSSVGVRNLPSGTKLGTGEAWPGGPVISNVPVKIDKSSTARVDNRGDATETEAAGAALRAERDAAAADVFAVEGTSHLVFYVPGGGFEQWQPGVGKRIRHDRYLVWGLHYTPTGKPETDRSRVGLWFQQVPTHHEVLTRRVGQTHIVQGQELIKDETTPRAGRDGVPAGAPRIPVIPPNAENWTITGITAFSDDVTLYLAWPHMHLRGQDMTFIVTYPDGREEVVLNVPKYDFNWQLHYELAKPLKLPAGSTIKTISRYDNSIRNRYNPAPHREVYWAEQSWDEMFNGWIDYSVDKLDLRLEKKPAMSSSSSRR